MISVYLISVTTLRCMESEPTTQCKDVPEFQFMKVAEKRYTYILNLTYFAPLIVTPGLQFQVRMEGKTF